MTKLCVDCKYHVNQHNVDICKHTAMDSNIITGQMVYYKCKDHRERPYGRFYVVPDNPCGVEGQFYVEKPLPMMIMLWELLKYKLRKSYDNMRKH